MLNARAECWFNIWTDARITISIDIFQIQKQHNSRRKKKKRRRMRMLRYFELCGKVVKWPSACGTSARRFRIEYVAQNRDSNRKHQLQKSLNLIICRVLGDLFSGRLSHLHFYSFDIHGVSLHFEKKFEIQHDFPLNNSNIFLQCEYETNALIIYLWLFGYNGRRTVHG